MTKNFKPRKLALALASAALFAAPAVWATPAPLVDGDRITLSYSGGANGDPWGGGEFQATALPPANAHPAFFTFCLEYTEHISIGSSYYVKLNNGTVNGGVSNAATYAGDVAGSLNYDPVSKATKWLYTQFSTNATGLGYDMSGTNNQTTTAANQAQIGRASCRERV